MWWIDQRDIASAAAHVPGLAASKASLLDGRSSLVFEAGGSIYRFADSEWSAREYVKEKQVLDELGGHVFCAVPVVEAFSTRPVYMKLRKIAGTQVRSSVLRATDPAKIERLVDDLARFLATLHGLDYRRFPSADNDHGTIILSRLESYVGPLRERDPSGPAAGIAEVTARELAVADTRLTGVVLLHGDFGVLNSLFDTATGSLLGVVDFTVSWIGDPHWDFTVVRSAIGDGLFMRLVEKYQAFRGVTLDVSLIMALERAQLCHFLYWARPDQRERVAQQLAGWRVVGGDTAATQL